MSSLNILYLSYILVLFGSVFTHGFYSFGGAILLLGSFFLLNFQTKTDPHLATDDNRSNNLSKVVLIISTSLSILFYGGLYQQNIYSIFNISQFLLAVAFLLSLLYLFDIKKQIIVKHKFPLLILIFIVIHFLMIISSPDPKIDIFSSLKYGISALLSFKNPYQEIYPQLYPGKILDYFSYFPTILFFFLPFNVFLGDVRFGIVFAQIIIVFILLKLFKKNNIERDISEIFILIFLYYPLNSYITEESFVDIIIILGLVFFLYYIYYPLKNNNFLFLISMFLMNTKQIIFFLIPIFLYKGGILKDIKGVIKIYLFASIFSLPFIIWSWKDFIYDVILIYFQPPQGVSANYSLNVRSLFVNYLNINFNQNLFLIISTLILFITLKRMDKSKQSIFKGLSFFFLGFFLFGSIAYLNHYYLVANFLLIYICSLILDCNNCSPAKSSHKRKVFQKEAVKLV